MKEKTMNERLINITEKMLQANLDLIKNIKNNYMHEENEIVIYQVIKNLNDMTSSILKENLFVQS
tara:strand:- start:568 stop:762 length:195 start_codon:yes stop_codon:yes gene_type:complete